MNERTSILHVEDDEQDVFFLQRAFGAAGIANPVRHVRDGEEAIDYLGGTGPHANRKEPLQPHLVLLDLKLPGKSGLEVLEWIRAHPTLRAMVVIVFSSSPEPEDVERAYHAGANSYIVKPVDLDQYAEIAILLKRWWLGYNQFAPVGGTPLVFERSKS
jgi:CheY-like chemotaxis protein